MNEDISAEALKVILDKGEKINFYDVREEYEYEEDNLGAINIPLGNLPTQLEELSHLKEEEIIIHCRSGARSGKAKKFLNTQGFKNVRNVLGGIIEMRELNLD